MDNRLTLDDTQKVVLKTLNSIDLLLSSITILFLLYVFVKFRKRKEIWTSLILLFYVISFLNMITWFLTVLHRIIDVETQYLNY